MSRPEKIKFLYFNNELNNDTLCIAADFLLALNESPKFYIYWQNILIKNLSAKKKKRKNGLMISKIN